VEKASNSLNDAQEMKEMEMLKQSRAMQHKRIITSTAATTPTRLVSLFKQKQQT
jgi:hypothetical protein